MKIFSISPFSLVGVDIQRNGIGLVKLKKIRKRSKPEDERHDEFFLMEEAHFCPLPLNIFVGDQIENWDALSSILHDLVASLQLKECTTVISLPANLVKIEHIRLPVGMADNDFLEEIQAHVRHDLRELNEPFSIDFVEISKCSLYSNFIFAVARLSYLSRYINCVQNAGLKVKIVDVDIYALQRGIAWQESEADNKAQVIFYAAKDDAKIIVFDHQEIIFYHQWDISQPKKWIAEAKHYLDLCLAGFPHINIKKLAICRFPYEELTKEEICLLEAFEICYPSCFEKMQFSSKLDPHFIKHNACYFLVAAGSAMRRVPKWLR